MTSVKYAAHFTGLAETQITETAPVWNFGIFEL
jgi:hypothetical protein